MSTYNRPDKFVPVNISSDPTAFLQYIQKRMDLMSTGEAMVRSQYNQILGLDFTHEESKQKINTFLQEAQGSIQKSLNTNLSNLDNVEQALKVYEPLTTNPEYAPAMLDAQYTKHYKDQMQVAESYKHMQDKKGNVGMQYSDYNMAELQQNYQQFRNGQANNPTSWGDMYSFTPYYDDKEEILSATKDFLQHPDSFEKETIDQNGMTQKVKYEGKSPEQLQLYLDNVLSRKAKDQRLLEGRVVARQLDNDQYIKMLQGSTTKNIAELNNQLADLEVFKKDKKQTEYTPDQLKTKQGALEGNLKMLHSQLADLNDPTKVQTYKNNKVDNYANVLYNQGIASLAQSLAFKKTSQTLGSNSAIVSLRNREQGANELIMRLNQEREFHNDNMRIAESKLALEAQKNAIAAGKEGLNPDGTPSTTSNGSTSGGVVSGGVSSVVAPGELTDGQAIQSSVDNYEKDLQSQVNGAIVGIADDAYKALGLTDRSYENDKKALAFSYTVAKQYANGELTDIMAKPYAELSSLDKYKKSIAMKFNNNDAKVIEAVAYHDNKIKAIKDTKAAIVSDLTKNGVTVQQINDAMNSTDFTDAYRQGGILGPSFAVRQHNFKSLDEVAQRLATDKEFAAGFDDRMGHNPIINAAKSLVMNSAVSHSWLGPYVPDAKIEEMMSNESSTGKIGTAYYDKLQKDIALKAVLIGNQQTISRPLSIENTLDKARNSEFENRINQLKATHPEEFKDINPDSIVSIVQKDGGYQLNTKELVGKDGTEKRGSKDGDPIIIADPSIKAISDEDASKIRALSWSPTGSYTQTVKSDELALQYKIGTTTGTPYTGNSPLSVQLIIEGVPIAIPQTFENPTSAETYAKEATAKISNIIFNDVTSNVKKAVVQSLIEAKTPADQLEAKTKEALKALQASGKFEELIRNKGKQIQSSGDIYRALGYPNPNLSSTNQKLNDFIGE